MTTLSTHTAWRRYAMTIDTVEIMTSPHPNYTDLIFQSDRIQSCRCTAIVVQTASTTLPKDIQLIN